MSIDKIIQDWDGQLCCSRFDPDTGAFFTIAVHSRRLGPAGGGTRAMHYPTYDAAVEDATRLASAMTLKMAIAGLPMGGGKSVIALPRPRHQISEEHWRQILAVHAENLATLAGNYWTGPDIGTVAADMDLLHHQSGYAFGRSEHAGGPGSSAPETAHGVHEAIHAAIREAGLDDLRGKRVLVQGLGAVGYDVASRVSSEGAHLLATDVDTARCERASTELGAEIIAIDDVLRTTSDVLVPCATGGIIDHAVAEDIQTRVVAGAANNLLASESAADVLDHRGIVLAPDFVANGGGAIHLVGREILGWSAQEVTKRVDDIGTTLAQVFELARVERISTERAARESASQRLQATVAT